MTLQPFQIEQRCGFDDSNGAFSELWIIDWQYGGFDDLWKCEKFLFDLFWLNIFSILLAIAIPPILVLAYGAPITLLAASLVLFAAIPPIQKVCTFRDPLELISVLQASAIVLILYTAIFCIFAW